MITLKRMRELRGERKRRQDTPPRPLAVATDEADCNGEICTAKDPRTCRVHGISNLAKTDFADKNKGKVDVTDAAYLRNLANSMTMEEVDAEIAKHFPNVVTTEQGLSDYVSHGTSLEKSVARQICDNADFVSESDCVKTKRCVAASIRDIHERFGEVSIPSDMTLFIVRNRDEGIKGHTVGEVDEDKYSIGIGFAWDDSAKGGRCFSHGDYRDNFDYVRHELFHAIESEKEITDFYPRIVANLGRKFADNEMKRVSKCAYENHEEAEAECFSKITAHDFMEDMNVVVIAQVMSDAKGARQ